MTKRYVILTLILLVVTIVTSKKIECRSLQWVPGLRRKVFTALINNLYCPTWTTRNLLTKQPTKYTKLRLPEGQPFSFNCGVCFTPGSFKVNLTAEMYPKSPLIMKPIPKNQNNKDLQHVKDSYTVCVVSYGLTRPIVQGGTLTCHMTIGTRVYEEKITYTVQKAITEEVGEEEQIEVPINGVVRLQCSEDKTLRIKMHTWYTTDPSAEDTVPFVVPSTNHEITYRPNKKEEKVSCATYDLTNPTLVSITRYKLILKETEDIKPGKWVVEPGTDPGFQSQTTSNNTVLIVVVIIVLGVFVASALVAMSFGLCKCRRRPRNPEDQTKDLNNHSLIPSVSPYDSRRLQDLYHHQ